MSDLYTSSIITALSHLKESSYGTARANSDTFFRIDETNPEGTLMQIVPSWLPDMSNAGSDEQAGKSVIGTNLFKEISPSQHFSFQLIGYWLQMIFGKVSKTGSSAPYTHTFTCYDKNSDGRQLPTRTALQREGSAINLFTSIGLKSLVIEKNGTGFLQVTPTFHGQGAKSVNPSGYSIPSANSGLVRGYNREVSHSVTDGVSTENMSCAVESWRWEFGVTDEGDGFRDCSSLYTSGAAKSGLIRKEMLFKEYAFKFTGKVRLDSASALETLMRSTSLATITTTITSPSVMSSTPYSLTISDANSEITAFDKTGEKGGFIYGDITAEVRAATSDGLIKTQAVLVNDKASYTS